jgi:diguanylate cyclase (GGDEF)-like protein
MLALLCALWPVARIRKILPDPALIKAWYLLSCFILLFIGGYLTYLILSCKTHVALGEIVVPVVFFFGGIFVFIVCRLFDVTAAKLVDFKRLEYESIRDPLTGTFNRRHMQYSLKAQADLARRNNSELSLILIDLDHFKSINDQFGHLCGDSILRQVSDTISAQVKRDIDQVFRYGGEEFMVMLPQTPLEGAVEVAEHIREMIARDEYIAEKDEQIVRVSCSASIGVGVYMPVREDIMQCLARVDDNMYQAKENGRNQVVH